MSEALMKRRIWSLYHMGDTSMWCPICKMHGPGHHSPWCIIGRVDAGEDECLPSLLAWCEEFVNDARHGKRMCRVCNAVWSECGHPEDRAHADWCWVGELLEDDGGSETRAAPETDDGDLRDELTRQRDALKRHLPDY